MIIIVEKVEVVMVFAGLFLLRYFKPRFKKSIPGITITSPDSDETVTAKSKPYGEPFVIRPDEYRIEQEQKGKKVKEEKGFVGIKEFVKKMKK